jgi:acyl dehydratase
MAATIGYDDVEVGTELPAGTFPVTRDTLVRYAGASGDFNPIHWNERVATSVGLPDVIAHGMHSMGRVGQYVTDWLGDPGAVKNIKTRFSAMVPVPAAGGNTVTVAGKVAEKLDGKRVRLEVQATTPEGNVAAIAEAIVELS